MPTLPKNETGLLSRRLQAAAGYVRPGNRVADVGCDHGKLSAELLVRGTARSVVATDINTKPLEKAKKLLCSLDLADRARFVCGDGLSGVSPGEVDTVVIAGVGYDTTAHIIEGAPWLKDPVKKLVLVPASHPERLRRWLYAQGFEIERETAVAEAGHVYAVMSVSYCGRTERVGAVFAALGKIGGGDAVAYRAAVQKKYRRIAAARGGDAGAEAREITAYLEKDGSADGWCETDCADH